MPRLRNKIILILSPQAWGKMFLSKHHYAIELAKLGNVVYFLNPPAQTPANLKKSIEIKYSHVHPNLFLIDHRLYFPYWLKFKFFFAFHWLMKFQVKRILKKIERPIDIIWSYDIGNFYPFGFFNRDALRIFHPVDEPLNLPAIEAAEGAEIIFSVTEEILSKYSKYDVPKHLIRHGLAGDFVDLPLNATVNKPLHIGYSGNLSRNDIDRETLVKIIEENRNCIFEFWGSFTADQSNIGGALDSETEDFIARLRSNSNVVLHGVVPTAELAIAINRMQAFLICYDVQRDQSKGTNSHKVMEYLSTGKVIISSNLTSYEKHPELVQMVPDRNHNHSLPLLFKQIINQLDEYNSIPQQEQRKEYARENSYANQVFRIEKILIEMKK